MAIWDYVDRVHLWFDCEQLLEPTGDAIVGEISTYRSPGLLYCREADFQAEFPCEFFEVCGNRVRACILVNPEDFVLLPFGIIYQSHPITDIDYFKWRTEGGKGDRRMVEIIISRDRFPNFLAQRWIAILREFDVDMFPARFPPTRLEVNSLGGMSQNLHRRSATSEVEQKCQGCQNYHGQTYGGSRLVCGIHPEGYDKGKTCPDFAQEKAAID